MDQTASKTSGPDGLDAQPDKALRALIEQASAILAARAQQRRREALSAIKRLAKEHGLEVSVAKPKRKRGRPRNSTSSDDMA